MFGEVKQKWNGTVIPRCVYISPEIAYVGITEQEAVSQKIPIKVEIMPFMTNGKAMATYEEEGFIKVIANNNHQILGCTSTVQGRPVWLVRQQSDNY